MQLSYDLEIGALYIALGDAAVARTEQIDETTLVDLDASGQVRGIEVTDIRRPLPLREILDAYKIPASEQAQVDAYFAPSLPNPVQEAPTLSIERTSPVCVPA